MTTICTSLCEARPHTPPRLVLPRTLAAAWIYRGEHEGSPHLSDSPQPSQLLQGGASHKPTAEACPAGGVRPWPRPLASAGPPDRRTGHRPTSSPPHRCTTFPAQPVAGAGLFQAAQVWWPQRRCSSPDFFGPDSPRDVAERLPRPQFPFTLFAPQSLFLSPALVLFLSLYSFLLFPLPRFLSPVLFAKLPTAKIIAILCHEK